MSRTGRDHQLSEKNVRQGGTAQSVLVGNVGVWGLLIFRSRG